MRSTFTTWLADFDRRLLDGHTCAKSHSKAIAFARAVEVPDRTISKLLAAAVLRSDDEVEAFDETERSDDGSTELTTRDGASTVTGIGKETTTP